MIKSLVLFQQLFIKLCISHIYILDQSYVDDYCLIHIGSHCFNTMLNCFFFRSLEVVVSAPLVRTLLGSSVFSGSRSSGRRRL